MTPVEDREELEEQREFLLGSLRDLEHEHDSGDISDHDYETLKADYTARAAAVLRALEAPDKEALEAPDQEALEAADEEVLIEQQDEGADDLAAAPNRRRTRAGVAVVLIVGFLAGAGLLFFGGDDGSPGTDESLMAGTPAERLTRAHELDAAGKALDALKLYDSVIKDEPGNVEALTYRGWLLARADLADRALASLDQAIAIDPKYPDPHFFRGMVLYRYRQDPVAAIPEFEAFLANNPPAMAVDEVKLVLERARQDAAAATSSVPPPPG